MLRFSQRFFWGLSNHRLLGWLMSVESLWKSFGKWCFVDGPEQKITCLIDFHDFPARLNVAILGLPYVRFVQCDTSTTRYRLVTTVQKRGLFCSHDWHVGAIKVPDPGLLCLLLNDVIGVSRCVALQVGELYLSSNWDMTPWCTIDTWAYQSLADGGFGWNRFCGRLPHGLITLARKVGMNSRPMFSGYKLPAVQRINQD